MTLHTTGGMTAAQINTELKRTASATFSLNGAQERTLAGKATGAIALSDFYGRTSELLRTATASAAPVTLQSYFTAEEWASSTAKPVVIPAGVEIGTTNAAVAALTMGSAGWGGDLTLEILGTVSGAGGAANSGVGGTAISVERKGLASQTLKLFLRETGIVRAGGGGGGKGGNGGSGQYTVREPASDSYNVESHRWIQNWHMESDEYSWYYDVVVRWNGTSISGPVSPINGETATSFYYGGWTYHRAYYQKLDDWTDYCGVYRTGAAGSSGGGGGAGGRGQGYNTARADGSGGSAGGSSAGTGGTGGRGGTFGVAGSTGATGSSGNISAGTAGTAGGAAGYAIASVGNATLSNLGTLLGRT